MLIIDTLVRTQLLRLMNADKLSVATTNALICTLAPFAQALPATATMLLVSLLSGGANFGLLLVPVLLLLTVVANHRCAGLELGDGVNHIDRIARISPYVEESCRLILLVLAGPLGCLTYTIALIALEAASTQQILQQMEWQLTASQRRQAGRYVLMVRGLLVPAMHLLSTALICLYPVLGFVAAVAQHHTFNTNPAVNGWFQRLAGKVVTDPDLRRAMFG